MKGILLAFQFFTVFPIKKELPLGKKEVTMMYCTLPFIGGIIGTIVAAAYLLSTDLLGFGSFLTAVLLVAIGFALTGGLHLDGWADTADAFFSYKTPEKRFEVLDDPRLGAFGTMALILLILVKIALIFEAFNQQLDVIYLFIGLPFIARACLTIGFSTLPAAKDKGIGAFFKERLAIKPVIIVSVIGIILPILLYMLLTKQVLLPMIVLATIGFSIVYFRRWALRNFNGITGDLAGAFIEGMEVLLWLVVLVLH